jgi:chromosome segregation ATPase
LEKDSQIKKLNKELVLKETSEELIKARSMLTQSETTLNDTVIKHKNEIDSLNTKIKSLLEQLQLKEQGIKTIRSELAEFTNKSTLRQDKALQELKTKEELIDELKDEVKSLKSEVSVEVMVD